MLDAEAVAEAKDGAQVLTESQIERRSTRHSAGRFRGAKILVLIPDHTRTIPLPMLFKLVVENIGVTSVGSTSWSRWGRTRRWMMTPCSSCSASPRDERLTQTAGWRLLNHEWNDDNTLTLDRHVDAGSLIKEIAGGGVASGRSAVTCPCASTGTFSSTTGSSSSVRPSRTRSSASPVARNTCSPAFRDLR